MRGVRGGDLRQHLTAWRLDPGFARGVRLIANKYKDDDALRKLGEDVETILMDWAATANVSWCRVLEDRPEIVTRRDHASPMSALRGRSVAVWGCGALGGHVALHLARAGAARIVLRDNAVVTPGVLIRQPYSDADIGRPKVDALADQLRSVRAADPTFEVEAVVSNVLTTVLDGDDWTDGADIVFDCTAARAVRVKLEAVRKDTPLASADTVSMIVNQDATQGLAAVAAADHTGGPADVYRRAKIDICRDRALRHVADAFYPTAVRRGPLPAGARLLQPDVRWVLSGCGCAGCASTQRGGVRLESKCRIRWCRRQPISVGSRCRSAPCNPASPGVFGRLRIPARHRYQRSAARIRGPHLCPSVGANGTLGRSEPRRRRPRGRDGGALVW